MLRRRHGPSLDWIPGLESFRVVDGHDIEVIMMVSQHSLMRNVETVEAVQVLNGDSFLGICLSMC